MTINTFLLWRPPGEGVKLHLFNLIIYQWQPYLFCNYMYFFCICQHLYQMEYIYLKIYSSEVKKKLNWYVFSNRLSCHWHSLRGQKCNINFVLKIARKVFFYITVVILEGANTCINESLWKLSILTYPFFTIYTAKIDFLNLFKFRDIIYLG